MSTMNAQNNEKSTTKRITGYILYCKESRSEAIQMLMEDNPDLCTAVPYDVLKKLASMWNQLEQNDKDTYNQQAQQLKQAALEQKEASGDEED